MKENQLQAKGFLVWAICALFFLYEFFIRTVLGTYQCALMEDLALTSFQFSILSTTIFLLIYGIMQVPAGLIVDNIGLKRSLLIGVLCCAISSIGFAFAKSYGVAMAYRMLMGFGASFGFICLLISVHDWMPHRYSGIFIGLSQFIGTLGPMLAAGPLESFLHSYELTWRHLFTYLGMIGCILSVIVFLFVENNRQKAGEYTILYKPEKAFNSIARLFSRAQPWHVAVLSASLYFTIEYLSENEGRAFLMLKGVQAQEAAYMITTAWVGYALGCPILGFISDIVERRKIVLQFCGLLGLAAIIILLYSNQIFYLQAAFLMLGISAAGQSIGFANISELFKKQFVAVGFGLNNAMITIISAVNAPMIGLLLDASSNTTEPVLNDYLLVFNILIAISVIAVVVAFLFIKETYCKSTVDLTILKA